MKTLNDFLNRIANNKRSHFWLFFIALVFLSLMMVYAYQPLCPGQDFFFHFLRFQALMDGLKTSPFLIYLDHNAIDGYGYFPKAFYCDFILVPFALIGNLTGAEFGYQFMIFTMTVLCGVFTYNTVNYIYKDSFAASIGALLYTFCIYRLLDVFHRSALGESLSFTFVPIVFLGLYHIIKGDYRKWYILAIGFSLLIFTHLISSVLMFVTMIILLAVYYKSLIKEPKRIYYLIFAGLAALVMVSYYLFPMLEQMFTNDFYYNSRQIMSKTQDTTIRLHWLIWGLFTGIVQHKQAFIPGTGLLLTCVVALRLFLYGKSKELRSLDIGVLIGLVYIFASSSLFPWSIYPFNLLNFIQLPWRLYEFTSFFFAVAGGYYLSRLLRTHVRSLIATLGILILISFVIVNDSVAYRELRCQRPIDQPAVIDNYYHMGGLEYIPNKVPSLKYLEERGKIVKKMYPETSITNYGKTNGVTTFDINTSKEETLELPLLYYKGYTAKLDNKDIAVSESENGLVQIKATQSGHVEVYYGGTFLQKAGWFISLISILALCVYIVMKRRKNKGSEI